MLPLVALLLTGITMTASGKSGKFTVQTDPEIEPNVIIIKFKPAGFLKERISTTGNNNLDQVITAKRLTSIERLFNRQIPRASARAAATAWMGQIYTARFEGDASPFEIARELEKNSSVEYAEPKYVHTLFEPQEESPDDSLFTQQTFLPVIHAPEAWMQTRGEFGDVVIAVIDGGTQLNHPDLAQNIWRNIAEIPNNLVDDDQNGYIDDIYGWNFANNTGDPTGLEETPLNANHGTHTGGLISAVTDNHIGVAGTSWNARLMAVNAGDPNNDNTISYGYEGILYAALNGASVISCSWGRGGGASRFEQEVIDSVSALGSVVIAAAGNSNSDLPFYPASYQKVLSVAATNDSDQRASFSNYGTRIDLAAPGQSILSTFNLNKYGNLSGTSMACPIVAGVVGLVKTKYPDWSGLQTAEQVRVTADNIDTLNPDYAGLLGKGRVNAARAVTESHPSIRLTDLTYADSDGDRIIERGESVQIYMKVINYLQPAGNISLALTTSDAYISIVSGPLSISQINTLEEQSLSSYFEFRVSDQTPSGHRVFFTVEIQGDNYIDKDHFNLTVMPTYANTEINQIQTTVTNVGRIGFPAFNDVSEGLGFRYKKGPNLLFEGAIIAGTSAGQISNAARALDTDDHDFTISRDGDIRSEIPGMHSDQETYSLFEDTETDNPMYIKIKQESFSWKDAPFGDFILLKYTVYNLKQQSINNFHFGLFFDWDMDDTSYDTNVAGWDADRKMGYVYDAGSGPDSYVGVRVLCDGNVAYRAIYNDQAHPDGPEWGLYDGFTDEEKWQSISGGVSVSNAGPADVSFVISAGPFDIATGASETISFVLAAGDNLTELQAHSDSAIIKWAAILPLEIEDRRITPLDFALEQNYPNPFNPVTNLAFSIPRSEYVELKVYSVLGAEVATIYAGDISAGRHILQWDAGAYASGVYLYRLRAGDAVLTRKLVLIR